MGGNIGYHQRDEEGAVGSIFWFTLPLAKGAVEPALTEAAQQGDDA